MRSVGRIWRDESGQSTVEYALVLVAFLGMLAACVAIWRACVSGTLAQVALDHAPYARTTGLAGLKDALLM